MGWARERWTPNFFSDTIPFFRNLLNPDGKIWLPYLNFIDENLHGIDKYYSQKAVKDPKKNPLFRATARVVNKLRKCPEILDNSNQLKPLCVDSEYPFCVLTKIDKINTPRKCNNSSMNDVFEEEDISATRLEFDTIAEQPERLQPGRNCKRKLIQY